VDAPGRLNVVDSSAWLAYFSGEPTAEDFAPVIDALGQLVVPAVCVFEVFAVVARSRGAHAASAATALMQRGTVVPLDATLAVLAARVGDAHRLPLADAIVYATARLVSGVVWTQDADFDGLPDVRFVPKRAVS